MHLDSKINVEFNNITLKDSNWTIYGLSLIMEKTNFANSIISVNKPLKDKTKKTVRILRSIIGHVQSSSGYQIIISECNINGTGLLEKTLLHVSNSYLSITNCAFDNSTKRNSGPAILKAVNSEVKISSSEFSFNIASNGLIKIENNSQLHLESCGFKVNGYYIIFSSAVISAQFNSTVHISNCTFRNNTGLYGSCIFCDSNTTVAIHQSSFANNTAWKGGVIFCQNIQTRTPNLSDNDQLSGQFKRNNVKHKQIPLLQNGTKMLSRMVVNDTDFIGNTANDEGGALFYQGCTADIYIIKCNFYNAGSKEGGSIYIQATSALSIRVFVDESYFQNDISIYGNSIFIQQAHMDILNSEFSRYNDSSIIGIVAYQHSILNIMNCTFAESALIYGYIYTKHSVILNVFDSKFSSNLNFPLISYFTATDNCSITVTRCYFTKKDTYTVLWNIHNFTSLTVTDSVFEADLGFNLIVLSATQNTHAIFTNCTFNRISGFKAAHNTSVNISSSRITNCISTLQTAGFMDIAYNSLLFISNSNITNNKVLESPFANIQSNSSMVIENCSYDKNSMSSHLVASSSTITISNSRFATNTVIVGAPIDVTGLMVVTASLIGLYNSHWFNNSIKVHEGTMFTIRNSEMSMKGNIFANNTSSDGGLGLIKTLSTKTFIMTDSIFFYNGADSGIVYMTSNNIVSNSFLLIDNCSFHFNDVNALWAVGVKDIIVLNSYFHTPRESYNYIRNSKSVRLWNSTLRASSLDLAALVFSSDFTFPYTLQLFTFKSSFIYRRTTLRTTVPDFLDQAESMGFIGTRWLFKMMSEESSYTSRKCDLVCRSILFISMTS